MKSELQSAHAALGILIDALPADVLPPPDSLSGLSIVRTYGWPDNPNDATQHIELAWDQPENGITAILEVIAAPGNANGPHEWTEIPNSGVADANGVRATHHLANAASQAIVFRLRAWRTQDNQFSEPIEMAYPVV